MLRSGLPWRDLPERPGPFTTCHNCFRRWMTAGDCGRIIDAITEGYGGDIPMIDGTSVRVHHAEAIYKSHLDRCLGRGSGRSYNNIHALTDGDGPPDRLTLTPGHTHDIQATADLLDVSGTGEIPLVNKAYDADWLRDMIPAQGAWDNIPPKSGRKPRSSLPLTSAYSAD